MKKKKAGLAQVEKDRITVDAWEFKKAVMHYQDKDGQLRKIQLGAYQTDFKTDGFEKFELVYLGKGTAAEYQDIDVKGKLVLVETTREKNGGSIIRISGISERSSSTDRRSEQGICPGR